MSVKHFTGGTKQKQDRERKDVLELERKSGYTFWFI